MIRPFAVCRSVWLFGLLGMLVGLSPAWSQEKAPDFRAEIAKRFGETLDVRYDQPYAGTENPKQMLDLFLPKTRSADKPLPVVVFIHGGGWSGGNRNGYAPQAAILAATGEYATASISYRLSQEAKWPAQIHDCKAAIRWIRGHAKELNLDADRIGVIGGSAGGHLVTMLGLTGGNKELEGDLGDFDEQSTDVTCVVNFYGPSDLTRPLMQGDAALRDDPAVAGLIGGGIQENLAVAKAASPMTYIAKGAPPILTIHGDKDMRVNYEQGVMLHEALKKAGNVSMLITIEGGGHAVPRSQELYQRIRKFWDKNLRGVEAEISTEPIPVE
ncbi:alpha/beta hydrolase [Lignipirellula cremea]|uniref:Carboxylesterase NlhH n=1 Tax=Lignipirellula cremea TaxID=2528010 RepID=A0A518E2G8_9BACT|nr:alpha/beta hydrolase [Lignipirellula cremea]QDU98288.1 Carboxylesterase NlhH [Lignipirellula cremea]